jgi:aminoglycoside phosphotransferase (APT) family kinase protein
MSVLHPDWKAIASELPQVAIRSAVPIGEGWTATAWRANDELVFKFPKRARVWGDLDRELAFLPYARPLLPLSVPEYLHTVRESAGAPHGYVVYRHLPGSAVDPRALTPRERTALAQTLAQFLRVLHSIDPAPVASILPRATSTQRPLSISGMQRRKSRPDCPQRSEVGCATHSRNI